MSNLLANDRPKAACHTSPVANAQGEALTVFFDGACPLCRREVSLYRSLPTATPVAWCDVSRPAVNAPGSPEHERLLARFHVRQADGEWLSGARAFIALWAELPGWRWLARVGRFPGMTALMELAYRAFLRLRPALQRVAGAFEPGAVSVPADMVADLRSDHAGETGAVWIYRGVLAVTRDPGLREFARRHLDTEQRHLAQISAALPWPKRSRLLPAWRLAGFMTGALPALAGPRAVHATIATVETFVDQHYQQQIDLLAGRTEARPLHDLLQGCQADEREHRDEAMACAGQAAPGWLLRGWLRAVDKGSALAVGLARLI
jgi:3-demethoxyubiquinol 3-hydroxylase